MAGTAKDYSPLKIQQGPGGLWLIDPPPPDTIAAPNATPQLTLYSDGTPDATVHPHSVSMAMLASGVTNILTPKCEPIFVDNADAAVAVYRPALAMKIEAEMVQYDAALFSRVIGAGILQGKASQVLTSTGVNVTVADTRIIDGKTYTFVTTPSTEGDVKRGADANESLGNLAAAINHAGVPGTDYVCAAAHATVTAGTVTLDHKLTITARAVGTAGNSIAVAGTAVTLSWGSGTLLGGLDTSTLTVGGAATAAFACIAAISPKRANPTKYIVAMLFLAYASGPLQVAVSKEKHTTYKITLEGLADPKRNTGRQVGIWYETL